MQSVSKTVLPVIVLSQFLCTATWFGGNAVVADLSKALQLPGTALGSLTSSVQLGFISGTLVYALLTITDRYRPAVVFMISAMAAAFCNAAIVLSDRMTVLLLLRFCTGFFLAGIYPVGMKIASDHYEKGLGKALGFLVGALVLGTAFPHLLKGLSVSFSWEAVIITLSILCMAGGIMMWLLVPAGAYTKQMNKPDLSLAFKVFRSKDFRSAAFGYFGHMWELYAFWAFVPVIIQVYVEKNQYPVNVSLLSFAVIGIGSMACVASGYISERITAKRTAFIALLCSGCCCILSPWSFSFHPVIFITFLICWGWMVIADSPMFSTLVAQNTRPEEKGTALTIVTCIGFFITVVSIELLSYLEHKMQDEWIYLILSIGPLSGLLAMKYKKKGS